MHTTQLLVAVFLFCCVSAEAKEPQWRSMIAHRPDLANKLQVVLEGLAKRPEVVNAVASVQLGETDLAWSRACGPANPATGEKMTTEHQFRIASVTKTFTAVVMLQLIEEGKFDLDSRLADVLSEEALPPNHTVSQLHVLEGTERGEDLTIRQLLSHTSGLPDYFTDRAPGGDFPGMTLGDAMRADIVMPGSNGLRTRMWEPKEILAFYCRSGLPNQPKFAPGRGFHYADTNYVLLGLAIESLTGQSLASNYRARILKKARMPVTYCF